MYKVRSKWWWLLVTAVLGIAANPGAGSAVGQTAGMPPATVLLIRHAEKLTDGRLDLSALGFERAKALPQLFDGSAAPHDLVRPEFLFATHATTRSNRPVETITPLAEVLRLPIDSSYGENDWAPLAKELLSEKYAGKVVLIAWHHGTLPELAAALGVSPAPARWPDTQFDRVWRIDYRDGKPTLADLPQELLAGDSK